MTEVQFWEKIFIHGIPDGCGSCLFRKECTEKANDEYDDCQHFLQRKHYDFMLERDRSGELEKEIYHKEEEEC